MRKAHPVIRRDTSIYLSRIHEGGKYYVNHGSCLLRQIHRSAPHPRMGPCRALRVLRRLSHRDRLTEEGKSSAAHNRSPALHLLKIITAACCSIAGLRAGRGRLITHIFKIPFTPRAGPRTGQGLFILIQKTANHRIHPMAPAPD